MNADALQSYVEKWLAVQPAQRLAMPFIDTSVYAGHLALAALEQEWIDAAYGIREPQVAQVKLNWWAEELAGAPASGGSHPVTRALFAAPQAESIDATLWLAPIQAAMAQLEAPTAVDFGRQCADASAFHGALARLETRWWFGAAADPARAEVLAVTDHLLHAAGMLAQRHEHERLALPMARLARHGLDRVALARDSVARREALHGHLDDIAGLDRQADALPGPLSLFRGLQMRENRRLLRRAQAVDDPLVRLQAGRSRPAAGSVFRAWAAARDWRRQVAD